MLMLPCSCAEGKGDSKSGSSSSAGDSKSSADSGGSSGSGSGSGTTVAPESVYGQYAYATENKAKLAPGDRECGVLVERSCDDSSCCGC